MKRSVMLAAACAGLAALGVATTAVAQAPAPCASKGDKRAKIVSTGGDMTASMLASVGAGEAISDENLAKATREIPCSRGQLTLGEDVFTLTGENGDPLPRKAVPARADGPVAFLAPYMDVSAVLMGGRPSATAKFIMVVFDAKSAKAVRLYTALPTDEALSREFAAALAGRVPPLASAVPGKQGVTAYIQTKP